MLGVLVVSASATRPVAAQTRATRILLAPVNIDVSDGPREVQLLVDGAPGLSRVDATLRWDSAIFALTAVQPLGSLTVGGADADPATTGPLLRYDYDPAEGSLVLVALWPAESNESGAADDAPPEAPPGNTGQEQGESVIGLDEGITEASIASLTFASLAEGESVLAIDRAATTMLDADGVPIDAAEIVDSVLRSSSEPSEVAVAEAQAASQSLAAFELDGGPDESSNVLGDAWKRIGSAVRGESTREAETDEGDIASNNEPMLAWFGALLGGVVLAGLGWWIGRDPEDTEDATEER